MTSLRHRRRPCTAGLALLLALGVGRAAVAGARGERPPSLLLIVSDDQRADAIGALGNPQVRTPALDGLAGEGFVFERAYCMGSYSGAVCCPSRAMLLSGRHLFRFERPNPQPAADLPSLPAVLRDGGWTTFATGKWHNGRAWLQRGFEQGDAVFLGGMGSHTELSVRDFTSVGEVREGEPYTIAAFSSTTFARAAAEFLRSVPPEDPFLCYVAFTAPHDPRTPPAEVRALYDPADLDLPPNFLPRHPFDNGELVIRDEKLAPTPRDPDVIREHLADYYAMITQMDTQVGELLGTLAESGRAGDTIVVFTSDQGLAVGSHGLLGKQNLYEHSVRAPLIVRAPGVPRGRSDALVYLFDLVPTLCELLDLEAPAGVDGASLVPVLRGEQATVRDSVFLAYKDVQRAVTDGRWKLIRYPKVDRIQLFDLERDPHEVVDLAADPDQAERVQGLTTRLRAWQRELGDEAPLEVEQPAGGR
jgi:arylsulfatase A-like enzyme